MAELFSADWMNGLKDEWNADPEVKDRLAEIGFNSVITCGFKNEDKPRGVFVVENGECVRAGDYDGSTPDWDMRADRSNWMKWASDGIGMAGLGTAFAMAHVAYSLIQRFRQLQTRQLYLHHLRFSHSDTEIFYEMVDHKSRGKVT